MKSEFNRIITDLESVPLIIDGMRDHGKTSSLKTLVQYIKEKRPTWIIKVFDISLAWYHQGPITYRQLVNRDSFKGLLQNKGDCLYEMGKLNDDGKRTFIATIINNDFLTRYNAKIKDPDFEDNYPWILYIFEEGNTYFDSKSLIRKDWQKDTLKDFISAGRNYKQAAILVATRVSGEVSPGYRNRCAYLLGRITGKEEKQAIGKATSDETLKMAEKLKRFFFVYYNGTPSKPFRIKDLSKGAPKDVPYVDKTPKRKKPWSTKDFLLGLTIPLAISFFLLCYLFLIG